MDAKAQAHHEATIVRALMRLSSARREKLDKLDFETFVSGLVEFPAAIVEQVCVEIGRVAPLDFQPRFPPLYVLRESCFRLLGQSRAKAALAAPPVEALYPPLSDDKWAEIRAKFDEVLKRRTMPGARAEGATALDSAEAQRREPAGHR